MQIPPLPVLTKANADPSLAALARDDKRSFVVLRSACGASVHLWCFRTPQPTANTPKNAVTSTFLLSSRADASPQGSAFVLFITTPSQGRRRDLHLAVRVAHRIAARLKIG